MFNFSDKIIMITGATGNLGGAVAISYLKSGGHLILPDRGIGRMPLLFPEIVADDNHYIAEGLNIASPEDVEILVKNTLNRFGKIDILVHTVGGYIAGNLPHDTELSTWDNMHALNARTTFIINRAVVKPMLQKNEGRIINIGSFASITAGSKDIAYSSSKSDVARITESMSKAYKNSGIRVNAILPGTIDTPENREAMPNADFSKWVKPQAIAEIILFLTSPSGQVINGALIPVSG